jgi:DnaK suppressor protein
LIAGFCDDDVMDDTARILQDKRDALEAGLERMSAPPQDSAGISFGKRVGDGTSMAVDRLTDVATYDRLYATLSDVRRAQVKLNEETYGVCDSCGREIAPERMNALPWAVLCVTCAARS